MIRKINLMIICESNYYVSLNYYIIDISNIIKISFIM